MASPLGSVSVSASTRLSHADHEVEPAALATIFQHPDGDGIPSVEKLILTSSGCTVGAASAEPDPAPLSVAMTAMTKSPAGSSMVPASVQVQVLLPPLMVQPLDVRTV